MANPLPKGPILVVEDVPNVLELLEVTLRFNGYEVISARNGQEALEKLQTVRPVLVITDILMPKLDGYAFVYQMRKDVNTRTIPVIFLSATYVTLEDKTFALKLGAARFIEKPIDTEEFLLTVAELITQGPPTQPDPIEVSAFYIGYRERLENKLRHKNSQITRTQRLLNSMQDDQQRKAFETLLKQSMSDRDEIKAELEDIQRALSELSKK